MPSCSNSFTVVLVWLFRAWALRRWAYLILLAAFPSSFSTAFGSEIHQDRTKAAIAVWSWQTVSSGFFFCPFLSHACQEQVAYRRENQMAFQPQIAATLKLIQADLALVVLEATFHSPAREGHQKQGLHAGLRWCLGDEELHVLGLQDIAGHQQVELLAGEAVDVFHSNHNVFTFPH